jgi:LAO/AO transport system kinase
MAVADEVLAGNRRALARAISVVEDGGPEAHALLSTLYRRSGQAHVVGVTGAPGTGKSTLVNALARAYRAREVMVGIIAVDPTSPFSGGALLGDRVRMRDLTGDRGIFIRSMATRGSLGGLAHATTDVITVLDAAGYQRILVETVGVGQAEVDIAGAAHTTIVVEAPGLGDEVQAIKAGVLEIADVFAVNKADREGADRTVMALKMMQGLNPSGSGHHRDHPGKHGDPGPQTDGSWLPPIIKTIATSGEGIGTLLHWIETHANTLRSNGDMARRENARAMSMVESILRDRLLTNLLAQIPDREFHELIDAVVERDLDPYSAAEQLLFEGARAQPRG